MGLLELLVNGFRKHSVSECMLAAYLRATSTWVMATHAAAREFGYCQKLCNTAVQM